MTRFCDIHTWTPVPLECGMYACQCGATGWRRPDGKIRRHRKPRSVERAPTVVQRGERFTMSARGNGAGWVDGYRVEALPPHP